MGAQRPVVGGQQRQEQIGIDASGADANGQGVQGEGVLSSSTVEKAGSSKAHGAWWSRSGSGRSKEGRPSSANNMRRRRGSSCSEGGERIEEVGAGGRGSSSQIGRSSVDTAQLLQSQQAPQILQQQQIKEVPPPVIVPRQRQVVRRPSRPNTPSAHAIPINPLTPASTAQLPAPISISEQPQGLPAVGPSSAPTADSPINLLAQRMIPPSASSHALGGMVTTPEADEDLYTEQQY